MEKSHKNLFELANFAKKAGRDKDVVELMKEIIKLSGPRLNFEEYKLICMAYKNMIEERRASWRTMECLAAGQTNQTAGEKVKSYQKKIEFEIKEIIEEFLVLLENNAPIFSSLEAGKNEVNYYKMKGDCYRYKAELTCDKQEKQEVSKAADEAYQKGMAIAKEQLEVTDRTRLGLALNYSVFLSEIQSNTEQAYQTAKKALDDAADILEYVQDDMMKDSTLLIMERLQDNITLWSSTANSYKTESPFVSQD